MGERNKADRGVGPWRRKTCDREDRRSGRRRLGRCVYPTSCLKVSPAVIAALTAKADMIVIAFER